MPFFRDGVPGGRKRRPVLRIFDPSRNPFHAALRVLMRESKSQGERYPLWLVPAIRNYTY
jgi:hypothetical protein